MRLLRRTFLLLAAAVGLLGPAGAAAAAQNVPGAFDYYVLVLSWMPTHCRTEGSGGVARELYKRVRVPGALLGGKSAQVASPEEIERGFLDANPWLRADMIAVTCRRKNLLDIRVCFGRDLFPRSCGANEDQERLCPLRKITVPPAAP